MTPALIRAKLYRLQSDIFLRCLNCKSVLLRSPPLDTRFLKKMLNPPTHNPYGRLCCSNNTHYRLRHPYSPFPVLKAPQAASIPPTRSRGRTSIRIGHQDRCTAGSCFAQHIARHLVMAGLNHHVTEPGTRAAPPTSGPVQLRRLLSALRQPLHHPAARQLLDRPTASSSPPTTSGIVRTAARRSVPSADPAGGLRQPCRARLDPERHLAASAAVEEMDVFVFTLGLTEAWIDRRDGAVFPLAPGVAA